MCTSHVACRTVKNTSDITAVMVVPNSNAKERDIVNSYDINGASMNYKQIRSQSSIDRLSF